MSNVHGSPSLILASLSDLDDFLLMSHVHPDGDSIGSLLAMADLLAQMGKSVTLASEEVPRSYRFLEGTDKIVVEKEKLKPTYDNVIVLDVSDRRRTGELQSFLGTAKTIINIDHHQANEYASPKYVRTSACATGELVFELFQEAGLEPTLTGANALYTALVTDTGRFSHGNTTQQALEIAAHLVGLGVDAHYVFVELYQRKDLGYLKMLAKILESMELTCDGKIAYLVLDQTLTQGSSLDMGDSEDYITYAQMIDGVQIALFFRGLEDGSTKISWRSVAGVDVSAYARDFDGGGHVNAAGCELEVPPHQAVHRILNYLSAKFC